jgi:hypothetical protein
VRLVADRLAPQSASTAAIASDGTCTMSASVPAADASARATWSQVKTSSEVRWKAAPSVRGWPSSGTNPRAKSRWWVSVHSDVPSPCTTTRFPRRIRSTMVHPPSNGTDVRS